MPALSKQFSLSLELTRFVPLGLNAIMSLARSLQNSGSNIVFEEDLAAIFGRCRISLQMERSFRTVVGRHKSTVLNNTLGLTLEDGPGPTVLRGLTQTPYLAMIIQCSLLTSVHEKGSLAAVIAQICEREAEEIELGETPRAVPSHDGLCGVLQACEDQTSSYNWNGLLLATARALELIEDDAFEPIPSVVLQGAVLVFPMIQTLPDDRMVLIDVSAYAGACSLVVWAHHVLGLTVLVKKNDSQTDLVEKQFGSGPNNVIIDLRDRSLSWVGDQSTLETRQPSITLLAVSENEPLLTLRSEPDEIAIDATYKQPAGGYAKKILESECAEYGGESGRDAFTRELTYLVVTFAVIISKHLFMKPRSAYPDGCCFSKRRNEHNTEGSSTNEGRPENRAYDDVPEEPNDGCIRCPVLYEDIVSSTRFLFNSPKFSLNSIEGHVVAFSQRSIDANFEMPRTISLLFDQYPSHNIKKESAWHGMLEKVRYLSIVLLAFAFVRDLDGCADLPLCRSLNVLGQHDLFVRLQSWDGKSGIWIPEDCWFLILAGLLNGHQRGIDIESTSLMSHRGWSVFLSTFGDADPTFTDAGYIAVKKGVPCRNGVFKHSIRDGPQGSFGNKWQIVHTAGAKESLRCINNVYRSKPLCGEQHGSFLVTIRFSMDLPRSGHTKRTGWKDDMQREVQTRRTGYREQFAAIWGVQRTKSCQHENTETKLPLSSASISGFGDIQMVELKSTARLFVCLTAKNSAARWRALLAIHMNSHVFPKLDMIKQVMLRGEDCCFQCAVNQTLVQAGHWFLVL